MGGDYKKTSEIDKIAIMLEVMTEEIDRLKKQRTAYARAINEIDDYFEYGNESVRDRNRVYEILDSLRLKLSTTDTSTKEQPTKEQPTKELVNKDGKTEKT